MNIKKLFLLNLPYLLFVYPFDKLAQAFRLAPGADLSGKLLSIGDGFTAALSSLWLSFHPTDLLIGIAGAVVLRMAVYLKGKNAKKYRHGIEYGSARWGTAADIAPYMDKDFFQNIPMTQTERITMASRPKQPKYARNKNILVIGGSGSGKTRFFCKPSLLQAHSSYVCTDPKGTLLPEIGTFLERKKYRIKCLNLINFRKSMKYNPLAYIRSEKDILKLVNALIMNTKGEGEKSSEDFWVKAERLYYSALIGYIWYEATEEEKNFITLLDLINASEAREDDETYQSPVDLLFSQLEEREPDHFAVKQYRKFKMAAGKTLKSILISCGARLAPFDIKELRDLMEYDELELDTLGDQKTALFVILSDTDSTFNFVAALMYSQLFNLLCDKADDFYGARLPVLRQNILLNRPGVHADANRDVVRLCRRRQFPDVRFAADVAGIDAQLVDAVFRRGNGKAVVEVDIRHQRHGRTVHQRADGAGAILVVHADAHDVAARFRQGANLRKRRLCVARVGVRHGLHPDRVVSAQRQVADANHSRFVHIIHLSVPSGSKRP